MAFLGIRIPLEVGRLLSGLDVPGTKESPSEYHITILCFDENWPITEISKALEATYEIVSKIEPFHIKATKVSHFPKREDNPIPIIAPIESDELSKMQKDLAKKFDSKKIEFKKTFKDYKPHITLAYSEDEYDDYKIEPNIELVVNELVLWGGDHGDDRLFVTFPLKGPQKQKHAVLLQKANIFEKIAGNPLQDFLMPSKERRRIER